MRIGSFILCAILCHRACCAPSEADLQFFETRIRPVLAERCYSCHAQTAQKLKGGLYTDSADGLLKGGDSGAAIVPAHPEQSRLITAIRYQDADLQMPPKGKLTDAQIADLTDWVTRGAPWPAGDKPAGPAKPAFDLQQRKATHWAWRPIAEQPAPKVTDAAWPRSPIDAFVLAKMEAKGLHPAADADRATLIRRAYFDLIGLPPTADDVRAFVDDASPNAFAKVVDHLLASDHFGERWARHWLDVVRFAETRGHEFDVPIPNAWQYRDYVVRAFNDDVPYDRFLAEQVAGDLLPDPRPNAKLGFNESVLGTGFWFLGEEVHSPVDIRQDEADRINSRLDTLTKAFQGLTVGCARCHDHKFDAISAKDHYALTGVLLGGSYRQVPFESEAHNRAVAIELAKARSELRPALLKAAAAAYRAGVEHTGECIRGSEAGGVQIAQYWKEQLEVARKDANHPLRNLVATDPVIAEATPAQVIADFTGGPAAVWQDGFTFGVGVAHRGDLDLGSEKAPAFGVVSRGSMQRDPAWPDVRTRDSEGESGALRSLERAGRTFRTAKVVLKSGNVWILMRGDAHVYGAVDTHTLVDGPLHGQLIQTFRGDANRWRWVRHDLTPYAGQRAEFEFSPVGGSRLDVAQVIDADREPSLPREQIALDPALPPDAKAAALQRLFGEAVSHWEAGEVGDPIAADWMLRHPELFSRADAPQRVALDAAVRAAERKQAEIARRVQVESRTAPAMLDGNGVDENILVRGVAKNPGERVPRRFLEAIDGASQPAYPPDTSGRLQLVDSMLRADDPFTARVMANRIWEHLFGLGIVPTVDNFGTLGQAPSHPELLDYLAGEFRGAGGWSVKRLIRSVVLSRTYQQASVDAPATTALAESVDPQNTLLHHMPVRRLEAEAIRDEMLAVSGRLDAAVGGPSTEVFLTPFMEGRGRPSRSGPLDGDGRRSLYVRVRRNFLSPMMLAFDAPIPFATIGRRSLSNVPAQALILMNDPFVALQANVWAKRVIKGEASEESRVRAMYLDAFARPPTSEELSDARQFLAEMRQAYQADDERPWADFAHVLFNTKEFIFVR